MFCSTTCARGYTNHGCPVADCDSRPAVLGASVGQIPFFEGGLEVVDVRPGAPTTPRGARTSGLASIDAALLLSLQQQRRASDRLAPAPSRPASYFQVKKQQGEDPWETPLAERPQNNVWEAVDHLEPSAPKLQDAPEPQSLKARERERRSCTPCELPTVDFLLSDCFEPSATSVDGLPPGLARPWNPDDYGRIAGRLASLPQRKDVPRDFPESEASLAAPLEAEISPVPSPRESPQHIYIGDLPGPRISEDDHARLPRTARGDAVAKESTEWEPEEEETAYDDAASKWRRPQLGSPCRRRAPSDHNAPGRGRLSKWFGW